MEQNSLVELLDDMTQGKFIRSFSGDHKKFYRLLLCCTFKDILIYGDITRVFSRFGNAQTMYYDKKYDISDFGTIKVAKKVIAELEDELRDAHFKNVEDNKTLLSIIEFFRELISNLDNNSCLFLAEDFEEILDVKKLAYEKGFKVQSHHWIDINLTHGLTPAHPEFFNYMDLINLWNEYIKSYKVLLESKQKNRSLEYTAISLRRVTLIAAVTFVESYLYYYFYNLKHNKNHAKNEMLKGILNFKNYVQDTQIVEAIYKLYPNIKIDKEITNLYSQYKLINGIRDRYIHTSAFVEHSTRKTELRYLLTLTHEDFINHLQCCVDLVFKIDELLSEDEKILYWKDRFENPIFISENEISNLNQK